MKTFCTHCLFSYQCLWICATEESRVVREKALALLRHEEERVRTEPTWVNGFRNTYSEVEIHMSRCRLGLDKILTP